MTTRDVFQLELEKRGVVMAETNPVTGGVEVSAPDGGLMRIDVPRQVDVLVYGATPGGIAAAISAKREGATVVVIEKDDWIGGMMTGGLSLADVNTSHARANIVGFAREFFDELAADYMFAKQSFFQVSYNGEPKVYQRVIKRMLAKENIQIFTNASLDSVVKQGASLKSASFNGIGSIVANAFIDSTYEGDLLAKAGCSFFIGREANATYGETNNGIRPVGTSAQFTDGLDPYVVAGNSASGLLPGVWHDALGTTGAASPYVQSFNYRLCVTDNAGNKVAWPEPDNYNPLNYELLGREAVLSGAGWTAMTNNFVMAALQGTQKYDINTKGPFSTNFVDPVCTEYITATKERRAEIRYQVKQHILGLMKFLQTDSRIPAAMRANVASYGLCADEFEAYGGFSPSFYVREGRRLIGDFVLKESDITSANAFTDEIAYVYYMVDSHHARRVVTGGNVKNEGYMNVNPTVGAKIPLRIVLPKSSECTNLAVTFGTSTSHVAFCSVRMEPIHMAIGQAAGILAAISVRQGRTMQAVSASDVKSRQSIQQTRVGVGKVLNTDATFTGGTLTVTGSWSDGSAITGYLGGSYKATSAAGASLRFAPNISETGQYRVFIKWPENQSNARSTAVPVTISHAGGTTTFTLNQNINGDLGDWFDAGSYFFQRGTPSTHYVQVGTDGTNSTVVSAVKWVPA